MFPSRALLRDRLSAHGVATAAAPRGERAGKPPVSPYALPTLIGKGLPMSATANRVTSSLELRERTRSRRSSATRIRRPGRGRCSPVSWPSRPRFARCVRAGHARVARLPYHLPLVDAWHVMNLEVARSTAQARCVELLERLFELTAGDGRRCFTLGCEFPTRSQ